MSRTSYQEAIQRADVMTALADYDPRIAGTPPLGLDLPTSDIDVLCFAPDPDRFTSAVQTSFGSCQDFRVWQWISADRPVVATFLAKGWRFEIFGQRKPVGEQIGWRHFVVEQRLLALGGQRLATSVMAFRRAGLKTEPAFAAALNLSGDPYQSILEMDNHSDAALAQLILRATDIH
jgi:hypothetical protein